MSYNLLPELAVAIGTKRMVELCEHFLWVTDHKRAFDASGGVIPPVWRDCSGLGQAASVVPPLWLPHQTPPRASVPQACPGAPRRLEQRVAGTLPPADAWTPAPARALFNSPAVTAVAPALSPPDSPLAPRPLADPKNPQNCPLHMVSEGGLGYSRNASGFYSSFSPPCNGCRKGKEEAEEPKARPLPVEAPRKV